MADFAYEKLRELCRLKFETKLKNRQIGRALNISPGSVSYYARALEASGITWPKIARLGQCQRVNAFEFFAGAPELLVPDNLKSAIKDSNKYDPVANPTYADMAAHYKTTILPARPRAPKDKGKVENAVLVVERWIMARLSKQKFYSLNALNNAIAQLLETMNNKPFQKKEGSRYSQYQSFEKQALKSLPKTHYEFARFNLLTVKSDYHVCVDNHDYSVPYHLIGEKITARSTHL